MLLLLTGATGKVGNHFLNRLLADPAWSHARVRALCHNRVVPETDRVEVARGTIADRDTVDHVMAGVTHIVHLATCKETPEDAMDVSVKGMFWLLEAARQSQDFQQFVHIGADAGIGHFFYRYAEPVTEQHPHQAYPGCYPLSKVLEEVMIEQYYVQYDLPGCCLRPPWIQEKDDFKYTLSFGEDVFGGPRWRDMVGAERADMYVSDGTVPLLLDSAGVPLKRNFIHVDDLASAILAALDNPAAHQELFNISMDEPVDYAEVAAHLRRTRGLPSVNIPSEYESTWLDNTKAKFLLGWRPRYDLARLIDEAWDYQRPADDPRKIWYPG